MALHCRQNDSLQSLASAFQTSNADARGLGLVCFFHSMRDPIVDFDVQMAIPVVSLLVVVCAVIAKHAYANYQRRKADTLSIQRLSVEPDQPLIAAEPTTPLSFAQEIVKYSLAVLLFFYLGLALRILGAFVCVPDPITGVKYLDSMPWLSCSDTVWGTLRDRAVAFLLLYLFGIPCYFVCLLAANRSSLSSATTIAWLGALYAGFR